MTTTSKIKLILDSMNIFADKLTDEDTDKISEVLGEIATRIALEDMEHMRNKTKREVTKDPSELLERIRIKLYTKECIKQMRGLMKPR